MFKQFIQFAYLSMDPDMLPFNNNFLKWSEEIIIPSSPKRNSIHFFMKLRSISFANRVRVLLK
jgi:hypothetical protein